MIREFNQKWEQDYVRKTTETLQPQTDRTKITHEKNTQRRTGVVWRTTSHNGRDVTAQDQVDSQVGGHEDYKKIMNLPNGHTQVV